MSKLDAAFSRANDRLFAAFGDEAVLRVDEPVVAVISRNVKLTDDYGEVARTVTTATLMRASNPQKDDPLTVGGESWVLDAEQDGDDLTVEFIVRPA